MLVNKPIRVLLVDDCETFRFGLRRVLHAAQDITVVGEASNYDEAMKQVESLQPDVMLLDCRMLGGDGTQVAMMVRQHGWQTNMLALSAHDDDEYVRGMLDAGAIGYVLKEESPERIVEAVRAAARGEGWFSPAIAARIATWMQRETTTISQVALTGRERQVVRLLANGWRNKQIAGELVISEATVCFYLRNIYAKIGVQSRTEAAAWAIRNGLTDIEPRISGGSDR